MARMGLVNGVVVAGLAVLAQIAVHGERAKACGWGGDDEYYGFDTTFDAQVLGAADYDVFTSSAADFCYACGSSTLVDEWFGYLKATQISRAEVEKLLTTATASDFTALAQKLGGAKKQGKLAPAIAALPFLKNPTSPATLVAAFTELVLARRLEAHTTYDPNTSDGKPQTAPPAALLKAADAGVKAAGTDAFLAQRYAFLGLRIRFYQDDYAAVIKYVDATPALAAPSIDLKWRARWYYAGALKSTQKRDRAFLELAQIGASYPPLARMASHDFHPAEDSEWRATLKAAKTPHEQALLWRLVGINGDAAAAAAEILKLEPSSSTIPVLLVSQLENLELTDLGVALEPDAKAAIAKLEKVATAALAAAQPDRPWVLELVLGNTAALRGDTKGARSHSAAAIKLRPRDTRVAGQAHANISLALMRGYTVSPATEAELATELAAAASATTTIDHGVRRSLWPAYLKAGKRVDAELLAGASVWRADPHGAWDSAFLGKLVARVEHPATPWEQFEAKGSYTAAALHRELAIRYVAEGNFTQASADFATYKIAPSELVTTPYKLHIKDCWDCDGIKFKSNDLGIIHELVKLDATVKAGGKPAAAAALKIGTALMNFSEMGNTTWFYAGTHQAGYEGAQAQVYAKQAFDLSKDPEQQAAAAWLGARVDVGMQIGTELARDNPDGYSGDLTYVSKTWYPRLKKLEKTKYAQEVLKECGWYAGWRTAHP